jgi:hypothetical protein
MRMKGVSIIVLLIARGKARPSLGKMKNEQSFAL